MNFFRKKILFLCAISVLFTLQSCSWISKRKALFEAEMAQKEEKEKTQAEASPQMVTKTQYDQLLKKYEDLLGKVNDAEKAHVKEVSQGLKLPPQEKDESQIISQLSKVNPSADLAETVDVFGKQGIVNKQTEPVALPSAGKMKDSEIQNQLALLEKANKLVSQNRMDSALILLKELEESRNRHIRVRAKYYLAEMLFRQNEYDLAMQMYEEIINKYAFSGLVVNSLGRLIVCAEKLKLIKKQERYYSILHDFFES